MTHWLAAALILIASPVWAQYTDNPTASWFKNLHSKYAANCCDQSDCHKADSEWRGTPATVDETGKLVPGEGNWWAYSSTSHEWVKIDDNQITRDEAGNVVPSILEKAVLCESPSGYYGENGKVIAGVYCFAPPPVGF